MKFYLVPTLLTATFLTAVIGSAIANSADKGSPSKSDTTADRVAHMDRRRIDILEKAGMSSALEVSDENSEAFVNEALQRGMIIEVTLEQVEAALKAAAATPEREDDLAAMKLAHWGSYRFFLDEKPSNGPPSK